MRYAFILSFFTTLQIAYGSLDQDGAIYGVGSGKLSKERFNAVISLLEMKFVPFARHHGRDLEFYTDYDNEWAQAFARRWETDQIIVYGGVAAIPGMTEDSLILALCHELGHLYGGTPYHDGYNRLSAEGQADYWAGSVCFPEVAGKGAEARGLAAALILTSWFADNRGLSRPRVDFFDPAVVEEVMMTHPAPQCRFDTFRAGVKNQARPCCWYLCR